jgi:hypothetical protein
MSITTIIVLAKKRIINFSFQQISYVNVDNDVYSFIIEMRIIILCLLAEILSTLIRMIRFLLR